MAHCCAFFALAATMLGAKPETGPNVLLLGGSSGSHRPAEMAKLLVAALAEVGIRIEYTEDLNSLLPERLAKVDVLAIYKDDGDLAPEQERSLEAAVNGGLGIVAIHCASHCFRGSDMYTMLIGGRFAKHGQGEFRARILDTNHPAIGRATSFETWDETYVHDQLAADIRVLMGREEEGRIEPYTWVRRQGKGRVFYTALGHDERTWRRAEFHRLLEQAVRWAASKEDEDVPDPDPGARPADSDGDAPPPLSPERSMERMHLPEGLDVALFASEPEIVKPLTMTFDARGRLWIVESTDYPNDVLPPGEGHDRIKVCEDTDGDGRADEFTVFAENLNIPTSLLCLPDALVVAASPDILLLRDTDGDGRADDKRVLFSGFGRFDSHAMHSNFRYSLDNWIWATIGYSGAKVKVGDETRVFQAGVFRFRPDGSDLEVLAPTQSNTYGLGFNEFGEAFVSKANDDHSLHLGIANRFYERVRGWHGVGIATIADHKAFHPIRRGPYQYDFQGGYTAVCGQSVYTARAFPPEYWNRAAMVCEPTGHLVHLDFLERSGSTYVARDGFNLLASTDPWTRPIEAIVGPDGAVWMIDWYNRIIQHNPTPPGYKTGTGNAYETPGRDKSHGRIYRIVARGTGHEAPPRLDQATPDQLVQALEHPNQWWRLMAQQWLVAKRMTEATAALDRAARANEPEFLSLHALATLSGMGRFGPADPTGHNLLTAALANPRPATRALALQLLPRTEAGRAALLAAGSLDDGEAMVRLAALLALAEMPGSAAAANQILARVQSATDRADRWLPAAATAAAAASDLDFLLAAIKIPRTENGKGLDPALREMIRVVANHYARGEPKESLARLTAALATAAPGVGEAVVEGLWVGCPSSGATAHSQAIARDLVTLASRLDPSGLPALVGLARKLGASEQIEPAVAKLRTDLVEQFTNPDASEPDRLLAARRLVAVASDAQSVDQLVNGFGPKSSPEFVLGVLTEVGNSPSPEVGRALVRNWRKLTAEPRRTALAITLRRPEWTEALLDGIEAGVVDKSDLALDQAQTLLRHPKSPIAGRAKELLSNQESLASPDRRAVLDRLLPLASRRGDAAVGKGVFEKNCAKCHRVGELGQNIGPELAGVAARKREDILADILDPNRSVEGNFRQFTILTDDGRVLSGLIASETKTAVELLDNQATRHVILRDQIEELISSKQSIMPEGFEKLPEDELVGLLEFLTARGKYIPLPLGKAATAVSTRGMFYDENAGQERLEFASWGIQEILGIPFHLIDPRAGRLPNVILLHGPVGAVSSRMPSSVRVPCNGSAKAIHLLSGISGWGYPAIRAETVSMIARLHYADGGTEDHPFVNGRHFADYIRQVDVPESRLALRLAGGQQVRYLSFEPQRNVAIAEIEFLKGKDQTAPVVVAVTAESR